MDSITSIIISGILYDLIKKGATLTFEHVFGNFYGHKITHNIDMYSDFLNKINMEEDISKKKIAVQKVLTEEQKYTDIFERELYNTQFAKRLDYVMYIINNSELHKKRINLEYLGEFLGFDSVNELMKYYMFEEEPSYRFCEEIANKLGVNVEWFKNGYIDEKIFETSLTKTYYAEDLLKDAQNDEYTFHFVLRKEDSKREILVVRKFNEIKFDYYPCPLIFNNQVGATGTACLVSLYKFLNKIKGSEIFNIHVVTKELFDKILEGRQYCGVIEKYNADGLMDILDDFLDIYHKYSISEGYGNRYGDDFLAIQNRVAIQMNNFE